MPDHPSPLQLDPAHAAFIQHGGSINVGARDAHNRPFVARAVGCRVAPDRSRVTVFVPRAFAAELLSCVAAHGIVAVVFNRTTTHEALQLKGCDALVGEAAPEDAALAAAYRRAFVAELAELGFPPEFTEALLGAPDEALATISFTPDSLFQQTPGPRAGKRLEPAA